MTYEDEADGGSQRSFDTGRYPTVRGTLEALRKQEIEYEDLKDERKEPFLEFFMRLREADVFSAKLYHNELRANPAAVVGIINDLYARGVEFEKAERLQFIMWLTEQQAKMDVTTFNFIFRRLPATLTEKFLNGADRMIRDAKRGSSGREGKSA